MKFLFRIAQNQVFETSEDRKANELRSLVLYQDDNFHFHFDNNFEGKPNSSLLIKSEMRQSGVDVRPCFAPLSRTGLFHGQKAKSIAGQLAAGNLCYGPRVCCLGWQGTRKSDQRFACS